MRLKLALTVIFSMFLMSLFAGELPMTEDKTDIDRGLLESINVSPEDGWLMVSDGVFVRKTEDGVERATFGIHGLLYDLNEAKQKVADALLSEAPNQKKIELYNNRIAMLEPQAEQLIQEGAFEAWEADNLRFYANVDFSLNVGNDPDPGRVVAWSNAAAQGTEYFSCDYVTYVEVSMSLNGAFQGTSSGTQNGLPSNIQRTITRYPSGNYWGGSNHFVSGNLPCANNMYTGRSFSYNF